MKKSSLILYLLLISIIGFAQNTENKYRKIPSVDVKTLDGEIFNTANISNNGKPVIISFWATWCKSCIKELDAIEDVYEDWQGETGVKLVAVCIDNSRSSAKVLPFVEGRGWDYKVLLDVNSDFKRAMNVNIVPHSFIINGKGEIVWQHTAYVEGDEDEYIKIVKELEAGKDILK